MKRSAASRTRNASATAVDSAEAATTAPAGKRRRGADDEVVPSIAPPPPVAGGPAARATAAPLQQKTLLGMLGVGTGAGAAGMPAPAVDGVDTAFCLPPAPPAAAHFGASAAVLTVPPAYVTSVDIPTGTWVSADDARVNTPFVVSHTTAAGRTHVAAMSSPDRTVLTRFNAFLNMKPSSFGQCHVYTAPGCTASSKILSFDLDSTLIKPTAEKAKFCWSHDDWQWITPRVVPVLQAAHAAGYKLVVFTNQGGVSQGHTTLDVVKKRCEAVVAGAGVPMQFFVAPNTDFYRKPATGMFWLLATKFNSGIPIDTSLSMYVGDAAGRPKAGTRAKDHSSADLAFAVNCGLAFEVPEGLFGVPLERNSWRSSAALSFITPKRLPPPLQNEAAVAEYRAMLRPATGTAGGQELVLLVGLPGAGKSTLCAVGFPDYERVNQDLLKTRDKCVAAATAALARGSSVIIDATNAKEEARNSWNAVASAAKVPLRVIVLPFERDISFHFDNVRTINPLGGVDGMTDNRHVPSMAIYGMAKSYEPPSGAHVLSVVPAPGPFTSPSLRELTLEAHGVDPADVAAFSDFWRSLTYAVYA